MQSDEQLRSEVGRQQPDINGRLAIRRLDELRAPVQSFNPTTPSRIEGRQVVRSPQQLRSHPALDRLGWSGGIREFNEAARLTNLSVTEPILITTNGIILAGFGRWRSALLDGRTVV